MKSLRLKIFLTLSLVAFSCSPKEESLEKKLLGEWVGVKGAGVGERLKFFESGVVTAVIDGASLAGDFRFLDQENVSITTFGQQRVFEVSIEKSTLTLTEANGATSEYKNLHDAQDLLEAVKDRDLKVVKKLLAKGAHVGVINDSGGSAWSYIFSSEDEELLQIFVENFGMSTDEALFLAISTDASAETVHWLLSQGANPNAEHVFHYCPLLSAISSKNAAAVNALLEAGADPSSLGMPAGHSTSYSISRAVFSEKCRVDSETTPLEFAKCLGNHAIIKMIEEALAKGK